MTVELYEGDTLLAVVSVNRVRKNLVEAGKGNGAHAFDCAAPAGLTETGSPT